MIAKLVSAAALMAAMASPAVAGDFVVRSPASQAYLERQDRVYRPAEIVAGTAGTAAAIATAPLAPRPYGYPADSYAYHEGPYVTYDDGYVVPGTIRPAYRGTYWNDPVGPVCEPGTVVRALDGQSYLCQ